MSTYISHFKLHNTSRFELHFRGSKKNDSNIVSSRDLDSSKPSISLYFYSIVREQRVCREFIAVASPPP